MNILEVLIKGFMVFCGIIALIAILSFLSAVIVYFLWNWLMPDIFTIKTITFWQAYGISFLSNVLFKDSNYTLKEK